MSDEQPLPVQRPEVNIGAHDLVISDISGSMLGGRRNGKATKGAAIALMESRKLIGLERYGTLLVGNNGRDMRRDALEEAADLVAYLRAGMTEGWVPGSLYGAALSLLLSLVATEPRK